MNDLQLFFEKMDYPYSDEEHDPNIIWGRIIINLYSESGVLIRNVIDRQWDIRTLTEWFLKNYELILNQEIPLFLKILNGSIAQKVFSFFNELNVHSEDIDDELFYYRQSHDISFGLSGTDTPEIYIAKNNGRHEISFCDEHDSWVYEISLDKFYYHIRKEFGNW